MLRNSNNTEVEPLLLTPVEAARALGIGRTLIFQFIRDGALKSVQIGRCRRIPRSAITEFIAARAA